MGEPCPTPQTLIEQHQGLVRSLAVRIHAKSPRSVDLEDLIAYGQVGLAEAAQGFDPTRGLRFATYAYYRIRGAIYDGLSKLAWFRRPENSRLRYQQMADDLLRLEADAGPPSHAETLQHEARWLGELTQALAVVYLVCHGNLNAEGGIERLVDHSTPGPAAAAIDRETAQVLHEQIEALPDEARTLIRALYFDGATLEEAGRRVGVSKSWASRLHARALERLARSLARVGVAG